jgi:non-canonical (house-cleaning) NTP pyrophosphatase
MEGRRALGSISGREHGGLISLLSHGRVTRLDYTVQALTMALFFSENPRWYSGMH